MAIAITYPPNPPKFIGETAKTVSGSFLAVKNEYGNVIWKLAVASRVPDFSNITEEIKARIPTSVKREAAPVPTTRPASQTVIRQPAATGIMQDKNMPYYLIGGMILLYLIMEGR